MFEKIDCADMAVQGLLCSSFEECMLTLLHVAVHVYNTCTNSLENICIWCVCIYIYIYIYTHDLQNIRTCAKKLQVLDFLRDPQKRSPGKVKHRTPFSMFGSNCGPGAHQSGPCPNPGKVFVLSAPPKTKPLPGSTGTALMVPGPLRAVDCSRIV